MTFSEFLKSGRIYLDGAMGTELIKRGFKSKAELLNVERPEVITEVHRAYVEAGSDIVCANTFGCNRLKADLSKYSLEKLIFGAYGAARKSGARYVLYDCGPLGELMYPSGRMSFEACYELFKEQALIAEQAGFDGVILETMGDLKEVRCALLAFKENTSLPVICSMSFEDNGHTFLGVDAECFALTAQALGAEAVGANCGVGPDKALPILKRILSVAKIPVYAKPNAGLPTFRDGVTSYDMGVADFAKYAKEIALAGVTILGGCCGTTPEYIRKMREATENIGFELPNNSFDGICSYARKAAFSENTMTIGERVNPTNRPLLKQALRDRDYDYIMGLCLEQREEGADALDINAGMGGIDEAAVLKGIITAVQGVVALPLCIDTAKKDALEGALRAYDGIALINSVNGEEDSMDKVFPLAKKYGAYVIALCLDKSGIPDTAEGRIEIVMRIVERAKEYGIEKERLVFDPLTMAVSVNSDNGKILLSVLSELKKRGLKTVLGLSNISFGLPARAKLNGCLLKLIKDMGVNAAIVNPSLKESDDEAGLALLRGEDKNCERYIAENAAYVPEEEVKTNLTIRQCVCRGLTAEGMAKLKAELKIDNAEKIMEEEIIGGLNDLGERYEKGVVFLPGLIAGSETAKAMLDYVKATAFSEGSVTKATVVIATVKGDVHDIGKNIVKTVASNYGYRMIDLGRDVDKEQIIDAVREFKADVVALSALMTTTLDNMTETVVAVKKAYPDIKIMVGGAVVTRDYAEKLGALYSKDAREACVTLEKLFG